MSDPKYVTPWYFRTSSLILLTLGGVLTFGISTIVAIIILFIKSSRLDKNYSILLTEKESLEHKNFSLQLTHDQLALLNLEEEKKNILQEITSLKEEFESQKSSSQKELETDLENLRKEIWTLSTTKLELVEEHLLAQNELEKINKNLSTEKNKLARAKTIYKSIQNTVNTYINNYLVDEYNRDIQLQLPESDEILLDDLAPTITLHLHSMDIKDLRTSYRETEKLIKNTLECYKSRYTTKANMSIYALMVLALQAEIQNILYNLKFGKLSDATDKVRNMIQKYIRIASDGNQNISATMIKFIGEIEFLFIRLVEIEFEYLIRKEKARQEQAAIREQMRQEIAERKELERQRKQIEMEEQKFKNELQTLEDQKLTCQDSEKIQQLEERIQQLTQQLNNVESKKEEIINLQNGKAGNVYIISNIGSFGENVFKVGMTRRLDPIDRINELGSASVPFKFDIHSFIFSEDAVALESQLHAALHKNRINKINFRKEFFKVPIDELEVLVIDIDPTAEFNKTILAEEFRQSLSLLEEGIDLEYTDSLEILNDNC